MDFDGLFGLSADNWVPIIIALVTGVFALIGWAIRNAAGLVKWLLENSQQSQLASHEERVSTLKDAHAERVSHLKEQLEYYKNRFSESLGENYQSTKEILDLTLREKDALDGLLNALRERQGAAQEQIEAQIRSKDNEIAQLRERYGAVTSTVISAAEPAVYRFIAEGLANLDIGASLEDPTQLKNYIIYWTEGDNHYFWDVVASLARLSTEELQTLHQATLIPMRILEKLRNMVHLPQSVSRLATREHEEIRKDLVLSVFLEMPRKRDVPPPPGYVSVSAHHSDRQQSPPR